MTAFTFRAASPPFRRWMGPFSPSRGDTYGFRVRNKTLGVWISSSFGMEFWTAVGSGAADLARHVAQHFGGGRVLLLPLGLVVKPLRDEEVGKRALVGWFEGALRLMSEFGETIDMCEVDGLRPGEVWPGPTTTGLECVVTDAGALHCSWYHPAPYGREETRCQLRDADERLLAGFRRCRPNDVAGRVRLTMHGHVITNRQTPEGSWECLYVGWVDPRTLATSNNWISKETS